MSRPRSDTAALIKEGHGVSLKVLRLSRPSLAQQQPLPRKNIAGIAREASLAFPASPTDQDFILSPNLSLPPAFGAAYVGEFFTCSLCANNELSNPAATSAEAAAAPAPSKSVSGIRIAAEMQTPTQTVPLSLISADDSTTSGGDIDDDDGTTTTTTTTTQAGSSSSSSSTTLQKIIRFELKEEGNHVLAVNVSYTETSHSTVSPSLPSSSSSTSTSTNTNTIPTSGRPRHFRKLYQFIAQPCLSVRTKSTELSPLEVPDRSLGPYGRTSLLRYVLEAQLENVCGSRIWLDGVIFKPVSPFRATSMNWDLGMTDEDGGEDGDEEVRHGNGGEEATALNPRDVIQIAFLIEQEQDVRMGLEDLKASLKRDGRTALGQIGIKWRGIMGEKGSQSTGNLLTRKRP